MISIPDEDKLFYRQNKVLICLFAIWIFRFIYLLMGNAGGVALNKYVLLQLALESGMMFLMIRNHFPFMNLYTWNGSRFFCLLYTWGCLSIAWSVMPFMSFYFAFQNFILLGASIMLFTQCKDYYQAERWYLYLNFWIFSLYISRYFIQGLTHSVTHGTIAGLVCAYCLAEFGNKDRGSLNREQLKVGLIFSTIVLLLASSSGAMVSVAFGLLTIVFFSKNNYVKLGLGIIFALIGLLYVFGGVEYILSILFPNKSMASIETANGRTWLWELILKKAAQRPWMGWGFATVERILEEMYITDAHNSFIGTLGSLGYIGAGLFVLALIGQMVYLLKNLQCFGFRGILAATVAAFINSNSSNFLVSKATLSSFSYHLILALGVVSLLFQNKLFLTECQKD